jgi:hypothetical protein
MYVSCFYIQVKQETGGIYYTTNCDTVEDGLTGHALEGNEGPEKATRGGGNGSQSKLLTVTWPTSQT